MSATKLNFFNVADVLALGGSFIPQSDKPITTLKRAQGLAANGDENISKTHGSETKRTFVYEHQIETGFITLPAVGSIVAAFHIDSVEVEYQAEGWPQITIQAHQHGSNAHTADNTENTFTSTVALPSQFGIPRTFNAAGEGGTAVFALGADDTGIGVKSVKYSIGCTHQDEDVSGEHLAGENRDGVEKVDVGLTGIPASLTVHADWDKLSDGTTGENKATDTQTVSLEKHIARDAEA